MSPVEYGYCVASRHVAPAELFERVCVVTSGDCSIRQCDACDYNDARAIAVTECEEVVRVKSTARRPVEKSPLPFDRSPLVGLSIFGYVFAGDCCRDPFAQLNLLVVIQDP